MDSNPRRAKTRARFIFESRWINEPGCEKRVKEVWQRPVIGFRMFKVKQKLKWCKHSFIEWRKEKSGNTKQEIELLKKKMECVQ